MSDSRQIASPATIIPVARPHLPSCDALTKYLKLIDENRWYSNFGPLYRLFMERLSDHFEIKPSNIVGVANATAALTTVILAIGCERNKYCLMPSWTFFATPSAALNAGLVPYFLDVDLETGMLSPAHVYEQAKRIGIDSIGCVMPVSAFGCPVDVQAWEAFHEQTDIPVVIDAAAAFDSIRPSTIPQCVSLHATKVFGCGEGSVVITLNEELTQTITQVSNFGFTPDRVVARPGINGKLSEYHAAVGLASLDQWPEFRRDVVKVSETYKSIIDGLMGVKLQAGWGSQWVSMTCVIEFMGNDLNRIISAMEHSGIETRKWWKSGCHDEPAFSNIEREILHNTEKLSHRTLGIPFYSDIGHSDLMAIKTALVDIF